MAGSAPSFHVAWQTPREGGEALSPARTLHSGHNWGPMTKVYLSLIEEWQRNVREKREGLYDLEPEKALHRHKDWARSYR
jgi:hypothetical protein